MAVKLNVSRQAVYLWVWKENLPIKKVLKVEKLTGVTRYELRPDVYGKAK